MTKENKPEKSKPDLLTDTLASAQLAAEILQPWPIKTDLLNIERFSTLGADLLKPIGDLSWLSEQQRADLLDPLWPRRDELERIKAELLKPMTLSEGVKKAARDMEQFNSQITNVGALLRWTDPPPHQPGQKPRAIERVERQQEPAKLEQVDRWLRSGELSRAELLAMLSEREKPGPKAASLEIKVALVERYEQLRQRHGSSFTQEIFCQFHTGDLWLCSLSTFKRIYADVKRLRKSGLI